MLYTSPPAPEDTPVRNVPPAIAATLEREAERQAAESEDDHAVTAAESAPSPTPADD